MLQIVSIAIGGALGALLRFWMSNGIHLFVGRSFPHGTLTVNVIGSFTMGMLYVLFLEKAEISAELKAGLTVGLLGAFTTFSTFSIETISMFEAGEIGKAGLNMFLSVGLCVTGCWLGLVLGRQI